MLFWIGSYNYYTSPDLALLFLQNHTHLCGTGRTNIKLFSKEIVNVPLDRGTDVFYKPSNGEPIMACKYLSHKGTINKK